MGLEKIFFFISPRTLILPSCKSPTLLASSIMIPVKAVGENARYKSLTDFVPRCKWQGLWVWPLLGLEYRPELLQNPSKAMAAGMRVQRQPPSGRNVPGSYSSSYGSCPFIQVAMATLPFKFGKFHEEDHPFHGKKKKKGHLSPRGSVLSLEDFSYKASHKIKRLWRLVNTNRKRVKTTFICTNSGFMKLKNLCPVKQLVQKIYFEYKNEERNIFK